MQLTAPSLLSVQRWTMRYFILWLTFSSVVESYRRATWLHLLKSIRWLLTKVWLLYDAWTKPSTNRMFIAEKKQRHNSNLTQVNKGCGRRGVPQASHSHMYTHSPFGFQSNSNLTQVNNMFFLSLFLQQARVLKNAKFWSQARMFLTPAWSYVLVVCVLVNSGFLHTFRGDFSQEWLTLGWHALEDFKLNILRQCVLQNASLYRTSIKLCLCDVWPFPSNCIVGSPFVDFSLILRIYSLHIRKR